MSSLSLTDIFFLVTGSAVIIITVLMAIGLLYIILFVRTAKNIARTALKATENVSEDIDALRKNIKEKGFGIGTLVGFATDLFKAKSKRRK